MSSMSITRKPHVGALLASAMHAERRARFEEPMFAANAMVGEAAPAAASPQMLPIAAKMPALAPEAGEPWEHYKNRAWEQMA
ncbi:MAG: hypothetical protein JWO56_3466 [Acidobacteria bacterium]|nr:hypothetical protein [Acidobacteriota bacterium]